jgi:hypothetical protein
MALPKPTLFWVAFRLGLTTGIQLQPHKSEIIPFWTLTRGFLIIDIMPQLKLGKSTDQNLKP